MSIPSTRYIGTYLVVDRIVPSVHNTEDSITQLSKTSACSTMQKFAIFTDMMIIVSRGHPEFLASKFN